MKEKILEVAIILCTTLFLNACTGVEQESSAEYEILNSSGHQVKLFVSNFAAGWSSKDSIFNIKDEEAIIFRNDINGQALYVFDSSDSISICFDDIKCISYILSDTTNRNLLYSKNFRLEDVSKNRFFTHFEYKYVITADDYNYATN